MTTGSRTTPWRLALLLAALLCAAFAVSAAPGQGRVLGKGLRIACDNHERGAELLVKPSTCVIYNPTMTFARSMDLHRLHWTRWSTSGATATGVTCAFRARCQNTKVRVTLTGLKRHSCGRNDYRVFTRAKSTSAFGTTKLSPPVCPQDEG